MQLYYTRARKASQFRLRGFQNIILIETKMFNKYDNFAGIKYTFTDLIKQIVSLPNAWQNIMKANDKPTHWLARLLVTRLTLIVPFGGKTDIIWDTWAIVLAANSLAPYVELSPTILEEKE